MKHNDNPEVVRAPEIEASALEPIVRRVRTDATAIKKAGGTVWTRERLTKDRLAKHLSTGPARGCCPIKAGESTTMLALFDLDSHKGETPWPDMQRAAQNLIDALELMGMRPVAFRSSGGRGVHVFLLWDQAQDAYSVRHFMRETLAALGWRDGTAGVARSEVEVFPKQDAVPADGFGNMFILPLAGASEPLDWITGLPEPMGREWAAVMEWPSSPAVPLVERTEPEASASAARVELGTLRDALGSLDPDLPHDEWARVLMGLHHDTEGSAEGLELAIEWSSRGKKFTGRREVESKWASFGRRTERRAVTGGTILGMARAAGWVEDCGDDFEVVATPASQGEPLPFKDRDRQGRVEPTTEALVLALSRPELCGFDIRQDAFQGAILIAPAGSDNWRAFTDADYVELQLTLERGGRGFTFKPVPKERLRDVVAYVAEQRTFDTARLWMDSLRWDGVPRVETFLRDCFGAADTEYTRAVSRYFWSALAGRVLVPGVKADMVPVAVGPQGAMKSSTVAAIVPSPDFFLELDLGTKDDDQARLMRGKLVIELGELKGLRTKEVEHIKSFITRQHEEWTPKYREMTVRYSRRCIFFGTTNQAEFLSDDTGHRRWLPFMVGTCDPDLVAANRMQLWAEARELFEREGVQYREAEHLARAEHEAFIEADPWQERVAQWLRTPDVLTEVAPEDGPLRPLDILTGAIGLEARQIGRREEMRLSKVMRALGFVQVRASFCGKQSRAWEKPGE